MTIGLDNDYFIILKVIKEYCEVEGHICEISVKKGLIVIFLSLGVQLQYETGIITISGVSVCN